MKCCDCHGLLLYVIILVQATSAQIGVETTFYDVANVRQYDNYGSVSLFEHSVPEMTAVVHWRFESGMNDERCPFRNITVLLQHGSYPLPSPQNNATYPEDFYLRRSAFHALHLNSTGNLTVQDVMLPTAGRWFGAAYIAQRGSDDVIKSIDAVDCRYYIRVNVTTEYLINTPQLSAASPVDVTLSPNTTRYQLYRFYVTENIWSYDLQLTHCSSPATPTACPISIQSRGGGLPTTVPDEETPVHNQTCRHGNATSACVLSVVSPLVARWHYVKVSLDEDVEVDVKMSLALRDCTVAVEPYSSDPRQQQKQSNDTHVILSNSTSPATEYTRTAIDQSEGSCGPINPLHRIEDMDDAIYAVYSLGPASRDEILTVSPHRVALVQFDVLPIKDSGGTLMFKAVLTEILINPNHTQNVTVEICLSPSRIPASGATYHCSPHGTVALTLDSGDQNKMAARREIPYPEPGPYFVGFQSYCYTSHNHTKVREPCEMNFTELVFELTNGPCVNSTCDGNGYCNTFRKGAYIFSACNCYASYRGYTCEDGSQAEPHSLQLLYSLLLSLSNLFFIPCVVVATYRRYYVEAVIYFSNMFFSGFYHACDMGPWSVYKLCIMPYHTLQFMDFLLSILSFWFTLVAMAELSPAVTGICHTVAIVALAMAVDWAQHTLLPYIAPISVGLILVIVMWIVRSVRRGRCYPERRTWLYMIPGFVTAVVGLVIFAFVQNDVNYPYTHSAWHVCIALSVVFLLPPKKLGRSILDKDGGLNTSSDEFEFDDHRPIRTLYQPTSGHHYYTDRDLLVNDPDPRPTDSAPRFAFVDDPE